MSGNVVEFTPRERTEPAGGGRLAGLARCGAWGHEWTAVGSVGTVHLECPAGRRMWGLFKNAVEPDVAWKCGCGELLFWLTPHGPMCRLCGEIAANWTIESSAEERS